MAALDKKGWCQSDLARECGLTPECVGHVINFHLGRVTEDALERISAILGLEIEEVCPPRLRGLDIVSRIQRTAEVSEAALLGFVQPKLITADPAEEAERQEEREVVQAVIAGLPERERDILTRRMAGETLASIATSMDRSPKRIRGIEKAARERCRESFKKLGLGPEFPAGGP